MILINTLDYVSAFIEYHISDIKLKKWNLPFNIAIVSNLFKTVIIEGVYIMVVRGGGWLMGEKMPRPLHLVTQVLKWKFTIYTPG